MKESQVLDYLKQCGAKGSTTQEIAQALHAQRSYVSALLNRLAQSGYVNKRSGKPVIYALANLPASAELRTLRNSESQDFEQLVGGETSLKTSIQKAKAAMIYPPHGLHTLLVGPTGVGKTMFAELMHQFAVKNGTLGKHPPFVRFNCADYASNPQLLMSQLFGSKKGAFTGADQDRSGLIAAANHGILFLDEIHRLPPEGQEMLFYVIDHNMYKPLGSVEFVEHIQVNLIGATTENPEEVLLPTLLRRLQVRIDIPALKGRTMEERMELIMLFFSQEASKIARNLRVTRNAVQYLLLYDCEGNIGQLKKDIQLGCANAYVDALAEQTDEIYIDIGDFSEQVRQGSFHYRSKQHEVDPLMGDVLYYLFFDGSWRTESGMHQALPTLNFSYEVSKLIDRYQSEVVSEQELGDLLEPQIDELYKRFSDKTASLSEEEFLEMVDQRLLLYVEDFVSNVSYQLERELSLTALRCLALHLQQSLPRFHERRYLRNYRLLEIRGLYPKEYELCAEFTMLLEQIYSIRISIDEIAFLTRFITTSNLTDQPCAKILILMHGESSAKSMANVVRRLIGTNNVYAFDMTLNMPTREAYLAVKTQLEPLDLSMGLLILVDMGSLKIFGEMLMSDLGITTRVLDMVSTALALECARLSLTGLRADAIYTQVRSDIGSTQGLEHMSAEQFQPQENKSLIITLCMTGEGTARKLQRIVEEYLMRSGHENILVHPLAVFSREEVVSAIGYMKAYSPIICIVGTVDPELFDIPFVSVAELVIHKNFSRLQALIQSDAIPARAALPNRYREQLFDEFFLALEEQTADLDVVRFRKYIPGFLESLAALDYVDDWERDVGLIFHIACLVEKLILKQPSRDFEGAAAFIEQYGNQLEHLHAQLHGLEDEFGFSFRVDDLIYILKIILKL